VGILSIKDGLVVSENDSVPFIKVTKSAQTLSPPSLKRERNRRSRGEIAISDFGQNEVRKLLQQVQ